MSIAFPTRAESMPLPGTFARTSRQFGFTQSGLLNIRSRVNRSTEQTDGMGPFVRLLADAAKHRLNLDNKNKRENLLQFQKTARSNAAHDWAVN